LLTGLPVRLIGVMGTACCAVCMTSSLLCLFYDWFDVVFRVILVR